MKDNNLESKTTIVNVGGLRFSNKENKLGLLQDFHIVVDSPKAIQEKRGSCRN